MSGSGGFYKYRCKYFYTNNCPNWVWVNNTACATCAVEGTESDESSRPSRTQWWGVSVEIYVPVVSNGVLQYAPMEVVAAGDAGGYWTLRPKAAQSMISILAPARHMPAGFLSTAAVQVHMG